jgi:hypothetical protein
MVTVRNFALLASSILGLTNAAPTEIDARQTFVPGTVNNTQEFYIHMTVTDGLTKYNGWARKFP